MSSIMGNWNCVLVLLDYEMEDWETELDEIWDPLHSIAFIRIVVIFKTKLEFKEIVAKSKTVKEMSIYNTI